MQTDPAQVEARIGALETRVRILLWPVAVQLAIALVMFAIVLIIANRL